MILELKVSDKAKSMLNKMPGLVVPAVFKGMTKGLDLAVGTAKREYLSGPRPERLGVRTGHLRRSIRSQTVIRGDEVEGRIGTNVLYARIHEKGGVITPKRAKVLRFQIPGVGWRSAKRVVMPARPFLRPAIMDSLEAISKAIGKEIETAFGKL
ncbi:MAG: phage virion morphogenesis protein [Deltaproteobacteria bacterium]|nr:phage virion morphogenesis protein [Deltaproteobacteria bacterium]MBW2081687.1 phage virion morphogenesis protein [Deltaproteobacteria bacterium]MBW2298882.1 phage virion morphogenesis protein [Deltaproteobacteria bacterium]